MTTEKDGEDGKFSHGRANVFFSLHIIALSRPPPF